MTKHRNTWKTRPSPCVMTSSIATPLCWRKLLQLYRAVWPKGLKGTLILIKWGPVRTTQYWDPKQPRGHNYYMILYKNNSVVWQNLCATGTLLLLSIQTNILKFWSQTESVKIGPICWGDQSMGQKSEIAHEFFSHPCLLHQYCDSDQGCIIWFVILELKIWDLSKHPKSAEDDEAGIEGGQGVGDANQYCVPDDGGDLNWLVCLNL